MNRIIAAVLVTLSIVAGLGVGFLAQRRADPPAQARDLGSPTATDTDTATTPTPEVHDPLYNRNLGDRTGPSWSPADLTGPDGELLELHPVVPGAIGPVAADRQVFEYMRAGYLVADQDPPCDGNHWLWAGQWAEGMYVSADPRGDIAALGMTRAGPGTAEGISVGNSLKAVRETYGPALQGPEPTDYGMARFFLEDGGRWVGFLFEEDIAELRPLSRVHAVEVTVGERPGFGSLLDAC